MIISLFYGSRRIELGRQRIKPAAGLIFIRLQQVRSVVVCWARTRRRGGGGGVQLNENGGEERKKRIMNERSSRATYSPRPFVRKREPEFLR